MNVPSKPTLRKALEEIVRISEESLATTKRMPARASFIEPLAEGYAKIIGLARTALGRYGVRPPKEDA